MSSVKKEQISWLIAATLFMAAFVFLVKDGTVLLATSMAYVGIVGTFLGLDLKLMIKSTAEQPAGIYEPMKKHRYILAIVCFGALLAESAAMSQFYQKNCDSLYGSFGVGLLLIIGMIVGGIEANKIVTGNGPGESK